MQLEFFFFIARLTQGTTPMKKTNSISSEEGLQNVFFYQNDEFWEFVLFILPQIDLDEDVFLMKRTCFETLFLMFPPQIDAGEEWLQNIFVKNQNTVFWDIVSFCPSDRRRRRHPWRTRITKCWLQNVFFSIKIRCFESLFPSPPSDRRRRRLKNDNKIFVFYQNKVFWQFVLFSLPQIDAGVLSK